MNLFDFAAKGQHETHRMHPNSLSAKAQWEHNWKGRKGEILASIYDKGPGTDKQIMRRLGFSDPNKVRPRITELVNAGALVELESVKDTKSGTMVRVVGLPT